MYARHAPAALALALGLVFALGCGDDAGGSTAPVTFGISDAPVGELDSVVITIERMTLNLPGDDIVIERFPDDAGDETITIDLLDYQGIDSKVLVDALDIPVDDYQNLRLEIIDGNPGLNADQTYVEETAGPPRKPIKVPSGELKLGGFSVETSDPQVFVIEFNLPKSMNYKPGPDEYTLKPRGVRVVDVESAAHIEGTVDTGLFDAAPDCDGKSDPDENNVVYLYEGHGLDPDDLGDLFDPDVDTGAAGTYIEPYSAHPVASDGSYGSSYLPAGDYTLAFTCGPVADDPELHQPAIVVPSPSNKLTEISLAPGESRTCNVPASGSPCS